MNRISVPEIPHYPRELMWTSEQTGFPVTYSFDAENPLGVPAHKVKIELEENNWSPDNIAELAQLQDVA